MSKVYTQRRRISYDFHVFHQEGGAIIYQKSSPSTSTNISLIIRFVFIILVAVLFTALCFANVHTPVYEDIWCPVSDIDTVKKVNDYREACLFGSRLKSWEVDEIASWAFPTGSKFDMTYWSFITIFTSLGAIICPAVFFYVSQNSNTRTVDSKRCFFLTAMQLYVTDLMKDPYFAILQIFASEVFEVVIQSLYLYSISTGETLQEPGLIRLQLSLVCMNILSCAMAFIWSVHHNFDRISVTVITYIDIAIDLAYAVAQFFYSIINTSTPLSALLIISLQSRSTISVLAQSFPLLRLSTQTLPIDDNPVQTLVPRKMRFFTTIFSVLIAFLTIILTIMFELHLRRVIYTCQNKSFFPYCSTPFYSLTGECDCLAITRDIDETYATDIFKETKNFKKLRVLWTAYQHYEALNISERTSQIYFATPSLKVANFALDVPHTDIKKVEFRILESLEYASFHLDSLKPPLVVWEHIDCDYSFTLILYIENCNNLRSLTIVIFGESTLCTLIQLTGPVSLNHCPKLEKIFILSEFTKWTWEGDLKNVTSSLQNFFLQTRDVQNGDHHLLWKNVGQQHAVLVISKNGDLIHKYTGNETLMSRACVLYGSASFVYLEEYNKLLYRATSTFRDFGLFYSYGDGNCNRHMIAKECGYDMGDCCCNADCTEIRETYVETFFENISPELCSPLIVRMSDRVYANESFWTKETMCRCMQIITREDLRCVDHWINMFVKDSKKTCGLPI